MPTVNVNHECGPQLQEIADVLAKSRKVVVVTGAGISTNCGIPDFRSENGLYSLIQAQYNMAFKSSTEPEAFGRPAKRRKLSRCASTSEIPVEPPVPRRLRSSYSFAVAAAPPPTEDDSLKEEKPALVEPPKPSTSILQSNDELSSSQSSSSTRPNLPNLKGKDLFDSMIWSDPLTTSIFYIFIATLRQKIINDVKSTTATHKFIKALSNGGRLVRNYTQNIDMLEAREGLCVELARGTGNRVRFSNRRESGRTGVSDRLNDDKGAEVISLHGSLEYLRCGLCAKLFDWTEPLTAATLEGHAPDCPTCIESSAKREGRGRRSLAVGRLRPDIVLYGEEHPSAHLVAPIITHDLALGPEVLLILGTSLRVHGLKVMVKEFAKAVHTKGGKVIFVNQTKPPESIWGDVIDFWVEWDCDAWVNDLNDRRKDIWLPQGTPKTATKDEKERPPAKHPKATRPDTSNGAHLTMKIMKLLSQLSGRVIQKENPVSDLCLPPSDNPLKKRRRQPRPNAVRDSKDNAAYAVLNIVKNIRQIATGATEEPLSVLPLQSISTNLPGRRVSVKGKRNGNGNRAAVSRQQLPSPPTSDNVTPEPPMTPDSKRIKRRCSISALLSSPISGEERGRMRIFRDS